MPLSYNKNRESYRDDRNVQVVDVVRPVFVWILAVIFALIGIGWVIAVLVG